MGRETLWCVCSGMWRRVRRASTGKPPYLERTRGKREKRLTLRNSYKALWVVEEGEGEYARHVVERSVGDLPQGEVLIRVRYSSLNYKDALSATGNRGVTRRYPHTPGVDAAGVVEETASNVVQPGDEVVVTGFDLGMNTPGGFGQYIRVPAGWVMKRSPALSLREHMILGSAGLTSALCVDAIVRHGVRPEESDVLVTGATGGVGSIAVAILVKRGYRVVACTGKPNERRYLTRLGAAEVVGREALHDDSGRPLLKGRWSAAIDTVGGGHLSTAIRSTRYAGAVACCGNAASADLVLTVYPFILRGVTLYGIDSQNCPIARRKVMWDKLGGAWRPASLPALARECALPDLEPEIRRILAGRMRGRVVVDLDA